jgi:hypothetical protein
LGIADEETGKKKLDFSILKKDSWTQEELKEIYSYLQRDIWLTKKLFDWVEDYFLPFKDFLKEDDIRKKVYLTSTVAKFTYLAACKSLGWEPVYGEYASDDEEKIGGGFVAYPSGEFYDAKNGPLYVKDVKSMYPHWFMMCNLQSRQKGIDGKKTWNGGGEWKIEGNYYADEQGEVALWIKKLYQQRIEYKKMGDRREYTIKIILNSFFGITDKEYYTLFYDKIAAGDCTSFGRQVIKHARKKYHDAGYIVIAADTDSVFLQDPFNDKTKLDAVEKEIVDYIKSTVSFQQDTFGFGSDEYKYFYFFK